MMIEEKVYNALKNNTDITNLVDTRIYPNVIPENTTYPCISYQTISNRDITTLGNEQPTLNFKRMQINIWSKKYGTCKVLEGYVKDSIYGVFARVQDVRDENDKELKIFGTSLDIISSNK